MSFKGQENGMGNQIFVTVDTAAFNLLDMMRVDPWDIQIESDFGMSVAQIEELVVYRSLKDVKYFFEKVVRVVQSGNSMCRIDQNSRLDGFFDNYEDIVDGGLLVIDGMRQSGKTLISKIIETHLGLRIMHSCKQTKTNPMTVQYFTYFGKTKEDVELAMEKNNNIRIPKYFTEKQDESSIVLGRTALYTGSIGIEESILDDLKLRGLITSLSIIDLDLTPTISTEISGMILSAISPILTNRACPCIVIIPERMSVEMWEKGNKLNIPYSHLNTKKDNTFVLSMDDIRLLAPIRKDTLLRKGASLFDATITKTKPQKLRVVNDNTKKEL